MSTGSPLAPLLEVQGLDLACDQLLRRRETLPEREALRQSHARAAALDQAHTTCNEKREELARSERELGAEVADVAAKAKEVENELYSGSVTASKELAALQQELRLLREKQAKLEEQELELLEAMEGTDTELADNRSHRAREDAQAKELAAAIAAAESEIDGEHASLVSQRDARKAGVPAPILEAYDRLRGLERFRGLAATQLVDGGCRGCHVKLPRLEYNRMNAEPADALVLCTSCRRILVR